MQDKTENCHSRIKPASISLTPASNQVEEVTGTANKRRSILVWSGLMCLAMIVFAVIFILPEWLASNTTDRESISSKTGTESEPVISESTPAPSGKHVSPWTEAQLAKQRKETQDILSEMLKKQDSLEELGVSEWANNEYKTALQLAESGDTFYRQRKFKQARGSYQNGLDELNRLLELSERIFADAVASGYRAIEAGDAGSAKEAFRLALIIKPDDGNAIRGNNRAQSLNDVLELLDRGDSLLEAARFEEAETVYQQVLDIDPDTGIATQRLTQTRQHIIDRDFTNAMSDGFALLEDNRLENARRLFQKALEIKPSAQEAHNALKQTENRITVTRINNLLAKAEESEQSESWTEAVDYYEQALKLDTNLTVAQTGKQNALFRANLDQRLTYTISNPLRLSDQSVYNEVRALYQQAIKINPTGRKLQDQIISLKNILDRARKPVVVTFQSNNLTDVTLYKMGNLESFTTRQVSLVPGRYVAVGKREGYRDVRVEFSIDPEKPVKTIVVQCEEKVAFGR